MRRLISLRLLAAAVALGLLAPAPASAGPILLDADRRPNALYLADYMQGYDFTPTTNLNLTALGLWDEGADGLPRSFQVGLWETAAQTLLASATISNADPLDLSVTVGGGNWRYETLGAPVALTAGTTYTLAFQVGDVDLSFADSLFLLHPTLVSDPNVSVPNLIRSLDGPAFTFPTVTVPADDLFRGMANALVEGGRAAVPEPSTVALLAAGAGCLALRLRRRR